MFIGFLVLTSKVNKIPKKDLKKVPFNSNFQYFNDTFIKIVFPFFFPF